MGWLDWSFDLAMRTDVLAIEIAHAGKIDMLTAIYGSNKEPEPDELPPFTPDAMRGMARR